MIRSATRKESLKEASLETVKPLQRTHVIRKLNSICVQLEKWAKTKKLVHPIRVKLFRCAIYGYSVMLNAMKDEELEFRIRALEEKMQDGVIIPK